MTQPIITGALTLADDRPSSGGDDLYQWAIDAEEMIRLLCALLALNAPAEPPASLDGLEVSDSNFGDFLDSGGTL